MDDVVPRWRRKHRKLRTAKKKLSRWLYTAGRRWDVRLAGDHDLCTRLAQRPPSLAVRLDGWRKLSRIRYLSSQWDAYSCADIDAGAAELRATECMSKEDVT